MAQNNTVIPSTGLDYFDSLLMENNPEKLSSVLDLAGAKLARITKTKVIWLQGNEAAIAEAIRNGQMIAVVKHQSMQPQIAQMQQQFAPPQSQGGNINNNNNNNMPMNSMANAQPQVAAIRNQPVSNPLSSYPLQGGGNNNNPNIINRPQSWVEMASQDELPPQQQRIAAPQQSKQLIVSYPQVDKDQPQQPEIEYENQQVDQALPQRAPGVHPGSAFQLSPNTIINSEDYVLVINPPFLGRIRPEEPVFQEREGSGLFYNNVGDCLQTNRSGRILVFRTKKGVARYATWPKPKASTNPEVAAQINELKVQLRKLDQINGWITIKNPKHKNGVKGEPALITIKKNGDKVTRQDSEEYFALIDKMRLITQGGQAQPPPQPDHSQVQQEEVEQKNGNN